MTVNDVDYLKVLQPEFRKRCLEICKKLIKIDYTFEYMKKFDLYTEEDQVYCSGNEYGVGYISEHTNIFPINFLYDESKIDEYIENKLEEKRKFEERYKKELEEKIEKRDKEEYERLKKKFE